MELKGSEGRGRGTRACVRVGLSNTSSLVFTVSIQAVNVYAGLRKACRIAQGDEAGALLTSVPCFFPLSCDDRRFEISDVLAGKSRIVTLPHIYIVLQPHCIIASTNACIRDTCPWLIRISIPVTSPASCPRHLPLTPPRKED